MAEQTGVQEGQGTQTTQVETINLTDPANPIWAITRLKDIGKFRLVDFEGHGLGTYYGDISGKNKEVRKYLTEHLPLDALLRIPMDKINIAELFSRRRQLIIPSKLVDVSKPHTDDDFSPNLDIVVPSGQEDTNVTIFMALQLIANPKFQDIQSLGDLEKFYQSLYTGNDFKDLTAYLKRGLTRLVSEKNMHTIFGAEIDNEKKGQIYQSVTDWLRIFTEEDTADGDAVTPFPTQINSEDYPDADFLPFAADSLLEFASSIPFVLKQGKIFRPELLVTMGKDFLDFSAKVLGVSDASEDGVRDKLIEFQKKYIALLNFYSKNSRLLFKNGPAQPDMGTLIGTRDLIEEIQKAGGRIGRKRHSFNTMSYRNIT